ncbi:unnamed protein product [Cuscuta epithymum]|uniref:CGL160/ATPI domain-containing protein n=1 Tax=Cuscuta epithymum TaxID=186058 RepID=A0AAV0D6B0_9ASTE|nr:unnamed protein product [Cuscuta epithymum]
MSYASAIFSQFLQPGLCPYSPSRRSFSSRIPGAVSVLKSYIPVSGVDEDYVLRDFLKERKLNGDFIARISDKIWLRDVANVEYTEPETGPTNNVQLLEEDLGEGNEGGFLKFKSTRAWLLGEASPPVNKKRTFKELQDDSVRRKMLNFLRYEALKRDLLFLTVSIGTACGGYCLLAFSPEAALSYTTGVFFSCMYLQLLCWHVDMLTREMVPEIFMKKKEKKIGIRSQDFKDLFERTVKGSGIALSSTRLVIPAAIYGLWELSLHSNHVLFDFQLVPAVLGLFVYKAAALVQVYRDNDDLQFVFPENEEVSDN